MRSQVEKYKNVEVSINGGLKTIGQIAEDYNIDLILLIAEYTETGDINTSMVNAVTKQEYIKIIKNYIYNIPLQVVAKQFMYVNTIFQRLEDRRQDALSYIVHSCDDELTLTLDDIISLLVEFNISKPVIDASDTAGMVNPFIELCKKRDGEIPIINRKDIKKVLKVLSVYRLSFENTSLLINRYVDYLEEAGAFGNVTQPQIIRVEREEE